MLFNIFSPVAPDPSVPYIPGESNVAFTIGSLSIDWYGIFVTIGFVLAIVISILKLKLWYKVKTDPFYYYCLMGIPLAIIGARFWSCCIGDGHWNEFFLFWRGGLAIQGGVIADILLALWWFPFILKKPKYRVRDTLLSPEKPAVRQVSMWVYADAIVPCILIGQIVGRWGNYFNQEVYGLLITPTDGNMWFLNFMSKVLPYMYVDDLGGYVQPLFLYEGMINFAGLIFLYVCMEFIPKVKSGTIGMSYFLWYGIVRISLEPLRNQQYTFGNTYMMTGIWIGLAAIAILLNQLSIIPKTRKYRCKFWIGENIVWWWNSMIHKCSISSCQRKINSLEKKIDKNSKYYQNDKAKQELTQLRTDYVNKLQDAKNTYKIKFADLKHEPDKSILKVKTKALKEKYAVEKSEIKEWCKKEKVKIKENNFIRLDQEFLKKSTKLLTKIKKYQANLKKSNQRLEYLNQKQLNTKLRFEKAKSTFVRTHGNYLYYLGK